MYQIRCDDYVLYDHRDDALVVLNPKCKLEANKVGEGSFTILSSHPYYEKLKTLRSIFEIQQDGHPIFRGRMTGDTKDFNNRLDVDLEGVLGFTNDSIIPPFKFPEDFPEAENATNVVAYFLKWILDQHNGQVADWQKLKLGNVTVTDPNNYITRSSEKYLHTWDALKTKLFESDLGGYLCIRYEDDGNYVDYVSAFELTNTQRITFGENLLDIANESDASETYSAILPMGKDGLTLAELEDGDLTEDLVKKGVFIYSKSAVDQYGWICVPVEEATWSDVTVVSNLRTKAVAHLTNTALVLSNTITVKAVDLHFTDDQIQSFRIYRNILVNSPAHGISDVSYPLTKLDIDILNPQNTIITIGDTCRTLLDINDNKIDNALQQIENTTNNLKDKVSNVEEKVNKIEGIDGLYFYVKYSQYADGHVMKDAPDDSTLYMGTCSTGEPTAPSDYRKYTWCRVRGADGKDGTDGTPGQAGEDGKSQYFHVKYSNDGQTFTSNNGETLGDWMGTCVNDTEADPTAFSAYTWKKIVGEDGQNGIDGADGKDGQSAYFYVKFSANANGNPMTEAPQSDTKYMGVCSSTSATAPTNPSAYDWTQCRGNDGTNGTPGQAGADGKTQYLHIKYSDDGETFTANNGEEIGAWIGTLVDFIEADSTNFNDYTWKKFTGDVQVGGRNLLQKSNPEDWLDEWQNWDSKATAEIVNGWLKVTQGQSGWMYAHYPPEISTFPAGELILSFDAYSDTPKVLNRIHAYSGFNEWSHTIGNVDVTTTPTRYVLPFTLSQGMTYVTVMIGTTEPSNFYVRNIKVETGNVATDWTPAPEDVSTSIDSSAEQLRQTMTEQYTSVLNTASEIIMTALESYVETSNYEEFRQTVTSQLEMMADEISMKFTTTTEQIEDVGGDLQAKFEQLYKYISFSGDTAITIGSSDSLVTLEIDNVQGIIFKKNGVSFGRWDGNNFYTGNIVVEVNERAQFGSFAFIPRSDGSLSLLKVGG